MKIYFAGSIRGGREMVSVYQEIISLLKKYGQVLTEHIGDVSITSTGQNKSSKEIFLTDVGWIEEADIVVADVTIASLGVGYELAYAESKKKRVICLYNGDIKRLSAMIGGNDYFEVFSYADVKEIEVLFEKLLKK